MSTSAPPASSLKPTFEKHLDAIKWGDRIACRDSFRDDTICRQDRLCKTSGRERHAFLDRHRECGSHRSELFLLLCGDQRGRQQVTRHPQFTGSSEHGYVVVFNCGFLLVVAGFGLTLIGLIHYPSFQFDKNPPPPCCCHHPSLHHLNQWSRQRPQGEPCPHLPSQSGDRRVVEDGM